MRPVPLAETWRQAPGRIPVCTKDGGWFRTADCRELALGAAGGLERGGEVVRQRRLEAEPLATRRVREGEAVGVQELTPEVVAAGAAVGGGGRRPGGRGGGGGGGAGGGGGVPPPP